MHTLYMIYDGNGKVTDFVIDNVSTTQNFISLDRGPLSYVQSIIDNLNTYIKKNGSLTVDSNYIGKIRHGNVDQIYGVIQDKRIENPNYTFQGDTQAPSQSAVKSDQSSASQTQTSASSASSSSAAASSSSASPSK